MVLYRGVVMLTAAEVVCGQLLTPRAKLYSRKVNNPLLTYPRRVENLRETWCEFPIA